MTVQTREMTDSTSGTCDWGGCDDETTAERYDPTSSQWLGVCARHLPRCPNCGCDMPSPDVDDIWTAPLYAGPESVVYYIGDPATCLVKIGMTTDLGTRYQALRRGRPQIQLLATEPGGRRVEGSRHAQFAALQVALGGEREWFRKSPELMEHVGRLRHRHGILCSPSDLPRLRIAPLAARP